MVNPDLTQGSIGPPGDHAGSPGCEAAPRRGVAQGLWGFPGLEVRGCWVSGFGA